MSRTYRRYSLHEKESIESYVKRQIGYLKGRDYTYEYYMTEAGQKAYNKAIEEWETAYGHWWFNEKKWSWITRLNQRKCVWNRAPVKPTEFEFKKARVVSKNYNFEKEAEEARKEYKKFSRDNAINDGKTKRNYSKHCAKELRQKNRILAHKILKEDESWEQTPYPDTYLGKAHIWDYW